MTWLAEGTAMVAQHGPLLAVTGLLLTAARKPLCKFVSTLGDVATTEIRWRYWHSKGLTDAELRARLLRDPEPATIEQADTPAGTS